MTYTLPKAYTKADIFVCSSLSFPTVIYNIRIFDSRSLNKNFHRVVMGNPANGAKPTCWGSVRGSEGSRRPTSRNRASTFALSAATNSCARASAAPTARCTSATAARRTSDTASSEIGRESVMRWKDSAANLRTC